MSLVVLVLCALVSLASSLAVLTVAGGTGTIPVTYAILALMAWALEFGAVALPAMGYFSAAGSLYLALALSAPKLALFVGFAGTLLRGLLREPVSRKQAAGFFCDFAPLAAACAAARWNQHPTVLLDVYLVLGLYLQSRVSDHAYRQIRKRTWPVWVATILLAPPLASAMTSPWLLLAFTPALWSLQFAAERSLAGYRAQEREDLRAHLARSWQELETEREERHRLQADLHAKLEESLWLEEVAGQFGRCQTTEHWADMLFRLTRTVVWFRSTAVLEVGETRLHVLYQRSPEQLDALLLAQPHVEGLQAMEGFVPGEPYALAAPISKDLLFYAGGHMAPTQAQLHRIKIVLEIAAANLDRVRQVDNLKSEAEPAKTLEQRVDALENVLQVGRSLTARLEPDEVVERLALSLRQLPHDALAIFRASDGELLEVGRLPAEADFGEIALAVAQNERPLLIDDVAQTRFRIGYKSILAVPVHGEAALWGVILLGCQRKAAFRREDQDWLLLLGYLTGQALQNAELHHQVVEALNRQRESEAQLIQSSKMAAVGQLAAGVAHELNTPLATVVLGLEASLRAGTQNPMLATALDAAKQAKEIVSKLLFYSRDARVGQRPTDLNQVVHDTLQLIGQQLKIDKVEVAVQTSPLPEVLANQSEIQQVLTNLLLNARDAVLDQAQRRVEVHTEARDGSVIVRVRDFGKGVEPELRGAIFEPFFTTKPVGKGTGLGLSVSQQIVQAHGGTLELDENDEPGTTFVMRLPVP